MTSCFFFKLSLIYLTFLFYSTADTVNLELKSITYGLKRRKMRSENSSVRKSRSFVCYSVTRSRWNNMAQILPQLFLLLIVIPSIIQLLKWEQCQLKSAINKESHLPISFSGNEQSFINSRTIGNNKRHYRPNPIQILDIFPILHLKSKSTCWKLRCSSLLFYFCAYNRWEDCVC